MKTRYEIPLLTADDCLELRIVLSELKRKGVKVKQDIYGDGREVALITDEEIYDDYSLVLDWLYKEGEIDLSKELETNIKDYANGKKENIPWEKYKVIFRGDIQDYIHQNGRYLFPSGECNFMLTYKENNKSLFCASVGFEIEEGEREIPVRTVINEIQRLEKEFCEGINWKRLLIEGIISKWLGRFPEIERMDIIQGKYCKHLNYKENENFIFTKEHAKMLYDFTAKRLKFNFDSHTGTYFKYLKHEIT